MRLKVEMRISLKKVFAGLLSAAVTLVPLAANADLQVVREIVVAPKTARGGANIGLVNTSANVSMVNADVAIRIGQLPASSSKPLRIAVNGIFVMKNEATESLALTVGFPVSNSRYSSFDLQDFTVTSDGTQRSVFKRITGYPWHLEHIYMSGPDPKAYLGLPDYSGTISDEDKRDSTGIKGRSLFGKEIIGREVFRNLLVWKEVFEAGQVSTIEVAYQISIPLQRNIVKNKRVKGNYKGIWPQEANAAPELFLNSLPKGEAFYFFDYYLTSGASWKKPIGEQRVVLRLDESWNGHKLYNHTGPEVNQSVKEKDGKTYNFYLLNTEPTENLFFALKRP